MKLPLNVDLSGKVAVITGAGGVLCSAFSKALAQCGAKVAVLDLNIEAAQKVADEIVADGGCAIAVKVNCLEADSLKAAHDVVAEKLGPCDILINGAGGNNPRGTTDDEQFDEKIEGIKTFFDLDPAGVRFVFDLNVIAALMTTQIFAKDMIGRGGNIMNVSSMNAFRPLTKIPAYSGAKSAVSNFTQWLATYLAKSGIRVNAIAPGFFVTNQNRGLLFTADGQPTARTGKILAATPMGRFGEADELLGAVLFLLCDEAASFITGVVLPIDGGFSAYSGV
ncbi:MAG: SDR family oxidoreductase [Clostridia bacterium]|nr:SDR family oxidoreductase [Clostridia bacterium]MBR4443886.1 SDR family oxidoreductase [Clostridia bacterium]